MAQGPLAKQQEDTDGILTDAQAQIGNLVRPILPGEIQVLDYFPIQLRLTPRFVRDSVTHFSGFIRCSSDARGECGPEGRLHSARAVPYHHRDPKAVTELSKTSAEVYQHLGGCSQLADLSLELGRGLAGLT